jgi:hypothetical protein
MWTNMRYFLLLSVLYIAVCGSTTTMQAQQFITEGKEFIYSHLDIQDQASYTPYLRLAVSARKTSTIQVFAAGKQIDAFMLSAGQSRILLLDSSLCRFPDENPRNQAIRVISDDTISIVAILQGPSDALNGTSADAARIYPIDMLGSEYIAHAYWGFTSINAPAEFSIVCPGDSAEVEIILPAGDTTTGGKKGTFRVKLLKDQVVLYKIQTLVDGVVIREVNGRKIAVFAGNTLANVPLDKFSADHLYEQMIPVNRLGREYGYSEMRSRQSGNTYTCINTQPNTVIDLSGIPAYLNFTNPLERREFFTGRTAIIRSDKPFSFLTLARGWTIDTPRVDKLQRYGDPFSVVPMPFSAPAYDVIFPVFNGIDLNRSEVRLDSCFISFIIHRRDTAGVILNGNAVPVSEFSVIPFDSAYYFAHLLLPAGRIDNRIQCKGGILSGIVYGFGRAWSYGYALGASAVQQPEPTITVFAPERACAGDSLRLRFRVNFADSIKGFLKVTFPVAGPDIPIAGIDSIASIVLPPSDNLDYQTLNYRIILLRAQSDQNEIVIDTALFQIRIEPCCQNSVKNGSFGSISASGCFPVEYKTDMDFREGSARCAFPFTAVGQIGSESRAGFANPAFDAQTASTLGFALLFGDPLPNQWQRAWIQKNPTFKGRTYRFNAMVRNVEKTVRDNTSQGKFLNFHLAMRHSDGSSDTIAQVNAVEYAQGWIPLSGTFVAKGNETELWVGVYGGADTQLSPSSYGFGIDDISLIPVPGALPVAGPDTSVCQGNSLQLQALIPPGVRSISWQPAAYFDRPNAANPRITPQVDTLYTLQIQDSSGCIYTDTLRISIIRNTPLVLTIPGYDPCSSDSVIVAGPTGGISYRWSDGSTNKDIVIRRPGGIYSVEMTTSAGCVLRSGEYQITFRSGGADSVFLGMIVPDSISPGDILSIPIIARPPGSGALLKDQRVYGRFIYPSALFYVLSDTLSVYRTGSNSISSIQTGPGNGSDTLGFIEVLSALGNTDTALLVLDSIGIEKGKSENCLGIGIDSSQRISIAICRSGGARLFESTELFGLRLLRHHTEGLEIEYNMIERGGGNLWVSDILGRMHQQIRLEQGKGIVHIDNGRTGLTGPIFLILQGQKLRSVYPVLLGH